MKQVINLLKTEYKIPPKATLILSVSGGIDSMSMLHLFKDTSFKIICVHFNHLKRDESIIEKDLVETTCKSYDIPFHYYTIKVSEGNFHHQAHILRNHYLKEVARLYETPYILTAHHLDDLFETILIKLTRGSNLLGYAGMQPIYSDDEFTYIKPLLYIRKDQIKAYAETNKVSYLDDSSNEENTYLRNRYRHAVVPIMKQENDHLLDVIKQYHEQLSKAFFYLRDHTKSLVKDHAIDLNAFLTWDQAIQEDAIAYLLENHDMNVSYEIIQKIKRMLLSKKPNAVYRLNKNHHFVKSYQNALIKPLTPFNTDEYILKEGKNTLKNVGIFTLLCKTDVNTEEFIKLCYNKLAFPLILRHRQDGDELTYDYGHKKLKKLLIDHKVPMEKRQRLWVLTDHEGMILWVQDYYMNQTLGDEQTLYFQMKEVKAHA